MVRRLATPTIAAAVPRRRRTTGATTAQPEIGRPRVGMVIPARQRKGPLQGCLAPSLTGLLTVELMGQRAIGRPSRPVAARAVRARGPLAALLPVPLYRREGLTLVLTEQGVRLAAHGRESHKRALTPFLELSGLNIADTVTLSASEGSYLFLICPALSRFTSASGRVRPPNCAACCRSASRPSTPGDASTPVWASPSYAGSSSWRVCL